MLLLAVENAEKAITILQSENKNLESLNLQLERDVKDLKARLSRLSQNPISEQPAGPSSSRAI